MGVTLFALLAFGVLTAASASATVTFLLAEWLVNGAAVTTELVNTTTGELLLEDTALKADVLCSGVFDGWVGPSSLDFISEVLSLAEPGVATGTPLSGPGITCEAQSTCASTPAPLVWPVNLPWETEVELMEDEGKIYFVDLITSKIGEVGYELECTVLGVKSTDECKATTAASQLTLSPVGGSVVLLGEFSEAFTLLAEAKLGKCTFAGGETGEVEGGGAFGMVGGGELTVSSDGITA